MSDSGIGTNTSTNDGSQQQITATTVAGLSSTSKPPTSTNKGLSLDINGILFDGLNKCTGIGPRVGLLFDMAGAYSDVQFIVGITESQQPEPTTTNTVEDVNQNKPELETIGGHKLILGLSSPVFASMFYSAMESQSVIRVPDCSPNAFKTTLEYIYKGNPDNALLLGSPLSSIKEVFYVARKYCIIGLEDDCISTLSTLISIQQVLHILHIGLFYDLANIVKQCWDFIGRNTHDVLDYNINGGSKSKTTSSSCSEAAEDNLMMLDQHILHEILTKDELNIKEIQLFELLLSWAKSESAAADDSDSGALLKELIGLIRFPTMSGVEFADIVVPTGLLTTSQIATILTYINASPGLKPAMEEFSTIKRRLVPTFEELIVTRPNQTPLARTIFERSRLRIVNHIDTTTDDDDEPGRELIVVVDENGATTEVLQNIGHGPRHIVGRRSGGRSRYRRPHSHSQR